MANLIPLPNKRPQQMQEQVRHERAKGQLLSNFAWEGFEMHKFGIGLFPTSTVGIHIRHTASNIDYNRCKILCGCDGKPVMYKCPRVIIDLTPFCLAPEKEKYV